LSEQHKIVANCINEQQWFIQATAYHLDQRSIDAIWRSGACPEQVFASAQWAAPVSCVCHRNYVIGAGLAIAPMVIVKRARIWPEAQYQENSPNGPQPYLIVK
tara:strand:- start:442 stop:750 length:309 start_codon:yes stop_codon:yes gene_type:complete